MGVQTTTLPPMTRPLTADAERSHTIPGTWYTDPAIYELEKEKIFYRSWQYVGHISQFANPGDYVTQTIADQSIYVVRGKDGELRGFYNVCQHRAHELLKGRGNVRGVITCPYHAWAYDLEGNLRVVRKAEDLAEFEKSDFTLPRVRVEQFLDFIFVNLDDEAEPLAVQAAGLAEDIRRRIPYIDDLIPMGASNFGADEMQAGWKVVVDNYVECYHCGPAHHAFADMISMDTYEVETHGIWSSQYGPDIKSENSAYKIDPDYGLNHTSFWYLWPNITFNALPGTNELSVAVVYPSGPESSRFVGQVFSADGKIDQDRADYIADVLTPEDVSLCESVQRGLKSKGYTQGRIIVDQQRSGTSEQAIHQFHWLVKQALEA